MRAIATLALVALTACGFETYRDTAVPIAPVTQFDAEAYTGLWYEVARFPVPFQEGCRQSTAMYELTSPSELSVVNTCVRDGQTDEISGKADVVGPGRLKVSFSSVPFVRADYWVLWVDNAYSIAVVGTPSGRAGWILSRTPDPAAAKLDSALSVLARNGYDTSRLLYTATPE